MMKTLQEYKEEQLRDPEFRRLYEEMKREFEAEIAEYDRKALARELSSRRQEPNTAIVASV